MLRFIDAANLLTMFGLASAVTCIVLAMRGQPAGAAIAMIVTGIVDLFDGVVARRLKRSDESRTFGQRLDSLVDACAFGMTPVVFVTSLGMNALWQQVMAALIPVSVVWRLAYFDTVGLQVSSTSSGPGANYYVGLPSTYVALFLPLICLVGIYDPEWMRLGVPVLCAALSLLMVSSIPIRKPGGIWYAIFLICGLSAVTALALWGDRLQP